MASVQKFNRHDAINILRHNERSIKHPSNPDIDRSRTHLNYSLLDRDVSDREYYLQRLHSVHCHKRTDVKTLCNWIVTAPLDLAEEDQEQFFRAVKDFINDRYGEENVCSAWVHLDEQTPHAHISFLPVVYDEVHEREKICANDVITRFDLSTFHPRLQSYLDELGIEATVHSGITRAQGGNRTVAQLKQERPLNRDPATHDVRLPAEQTPVDARTESAEHSESPSRSPWEMVWDISEDTPQQPTTDRHWDSEEIWGTQPDHSQDRTTRHEREYDLTDDWLDR